MSSGLIYFAVIALWVAYFLPRWLRSHDEVSESKSLERYRSAMHVVSMNSPERSYMTRAEIAERAARTLRKRQITLITLTLFFLATMISAFANLIPFRSLLLPLSLLVIFVVHVRRQKVQDDVKRRRRMATMKGKGSSYNFSEITYRSPEGDVSNWIPIDHSTTVTIIRNDAWQPNQMPLPTYVSAPKAPVRPVANRGNIPFDQLDQTNLASVASDETLESLTRESMDSSEGVFDQDADRRAANE